MEKKLKVAICMIPTKKANAKLSMGLSEKFIYPQIDRTNPYLTNHHLYFVSQQSQRPIVQGCWVTDGVIIFHNKVQLDAYIGIYKIESTTDDEMELPLIDKKFLIRYANAKGNMKSTFVALDEDRMCVVTGPNQIPQKQLKVDAGNFVEIV